VRINDGLNTPQGFTEIIMIKKIKKFLLTGARLAEYCESNGELDEAYGEYFKMGDYKNAGRILEKTGKWHQAANLYIKTDQVDLARRAIESCFKQDESWEMYEVGEGKTVSIEGWLQKKHQVRRFVRYVRYVDTLNKKGIPLIVVLAFKLKQILEYKAAADLYKRGFDLINKDKDSKTIKNEEWLRYAAECYARVGLYTDAAECMKELILAEVQIGDAFPGTGSNPYRDYTHNLKKAIEWKFLPHLLEILEDFDPFNIAYDLLKIGEPEVSMNVFFKFFGRVLKRHYNDQEREIRNKRIQYCINQYIIYFRERKEYKKAAEIALLNSQKEIAAELFKKADEEAEKERRKSEVLSAAAVEDLATIEEPEKARKEEKVIPTKIEVLKCPTCGEIVKPDWEVCPTCDNVLSLGLCVCGQKLKPHWRRCPACQRIVKPPTKAELKIEGELFFDDDTKPFRFPK
jgi:tetratricopeptide (TPR) repeat protein